MGSKFLEYGDVNLFESPGQHGEPAIPQRPQNPVIFSTLESRVALETRELLKESGHVNYGYTKTLPIKSWKAPLGPWNL